MHSSQILLPSTVIMKTEIHGSCIVFQETIVYYCAAVIDYNENQTHNHLIRKQTLIHLAKLAK